MSIDFGATELPPLPYGPGANTPTTDKQSRAPKAKKRRRTDPGGCLSQAGLDYIQSAMAEVEKGAAKPPPTGLKPGERFLAQIVAEETDGKVLGETKPASPEGVMTEPPRVTARPADWPADGLGQITGTTDATAPTTVGPGITETPTPKPQADDPGQTKVSLWQHASAVINRLLAEKELLSWEERLKLVHNVLTPLVSDPTLQSVQASQITGALQKADSQIFGYWVNLQVRNGFLDEVVSKPHRPFEIDRAIAVLRPQYIAELNLKTTHEIGYLDVAFGILRLAAVSTPDSQRYRRSGKTIEEARQASMERFTAAIQRIHNRQQPPNIMNVKNVEKLAVQINSPSVTSNEVPRGQVKEGEHGRMG